MIDFTPSTLLPPCSPHTEETMCIRRSRRFSNSRRCQDVINSRQRSCHKYRRRINISTIISCASLCILSVILLSGAHAQSISASTKQGLSIGTSVDLGSCYSNLYDSDMNGDGKLSPNEFLSFVQLSSAGGLDNNQYGIPITQFSMLPQEFIGIYNFFACGNVNYGCPSVVGIDIAGVADAVQSGNIGGREGEMSEQQETLLFQLCKVTESEVEKLGPQPTNSPTVTTTGDVGITDSPTSAPTVFGTKSPTIPATTPPALPPCPPLYDATDSTYLAGDFVSAQLGEDFGDGTVWLYFYYECKPFPQSAWCAQAVYEPGNSEIWEEAWTMMGQCEPPSMAPTPVVTTLPTTVASIPTPSPISVLSPPTTPRPTYDDDVELYSGPLTTTFEYEIYNTQNLNAESIMSGTNPENDVMEVLLLETTALVDSVVADIFGQKSAAVALTDNGVGHSKGNGESSETLVRYLRHRTRSLEVLLAPDSVWIDNVEDTACSDQSLDASTCQKVSVSTTLMLIDEQKENVQLRFQNAMSKALVNPGVSFPPETEVVYAGPASGARVVVIPGTTQPDDTSPAPEEESSSGTPSWVVPVSIGVAAAGCIILLVFVASRAQKRKRNEKEYEGVVKPEEASLERDLPAPSSVATPATPATHAPRAPGRVVIPAILGGTPGVATAGGSSDSSENDVPLEAEIRPQKHIISPLDDDFNEVENGLQKDIYDAERRFHVLPPGWMADESDVKPIWSSSESSSNSSSVPSGSYSDSDSSSSSDEDIATSDPREFWRRKEQEAMGIPEEPPLAPGVLQTLHEVSEENLSQGGWSFASGGSDGDRSDRSVYRAGIEALVKEACPEEIDNIDNMMIEYEGREEVLIGHLSTMLAAKNRGNTSTSSSSGADDSPSKQSLSSSFDGSPQKSPSSKDGNSSASSSTGSSGWSSDAGLSSIDASSLTTDNTDGQQSGMMPELAAIGNASAQVPGSPYSSSKPTFVPVDDDDRGTPAPTRKDLDDAIQAGDWKSVGATAALLSKNPMKSDDDFNASNFSVTSHEKHQMNELEQLVEAGNWDAVMAAATRYENASDHGSFDRSYLMMDSSEDMTNKPSPEEMRAEIEELVMTVVPDELENLDEMLLQFRGREEELIKTLHTMRRHSVEETSMKQQQSMASEGVEQDDILGTSSHRSSLSVFESDAPSISTAGASSSQDASEDQMVDDL